MKLDVEIIQYKPTEEVCDFIDSYGTLFHTYNFLNSVGTGYVYVLVRNDKNFILAVHPLVKSRKQGLTAYHVPPYAYQFGPIVHQDHESHRQEIITALLESLPISGHYDFKLFLDEADVIPFKGNGFTVTANQTHIFPKENTYDHSCLSKDKRRDVRKLQRVAEEGKISIVENDQANLDKILYLWEKTSERSKFSAHLQTLSALFNAGLPHYSNVVHNQDGEPISGAFCPYDTQTMYHLVGASIRVEDNLLSRSNLLSLFLAVSDANQKGLNFDFEGSNVSGVAEFYRMMGAEPKLIYRAQKTKSIYYQILRFIEQVKRERG